MNIEDIMNAMLADLGKEVDAELSDPAFPAHHHGRPIGYNKGCRGPLCTKNLRDRKRADGGTSANEIKDAYLEMRLKDHQLSLKTNKKAGNAA